METTRMILLAMISKRRKNPSQGGDRAIGERLARLRKAKGLSQTALAEKIGTSQEVVSAYERGRIRLHAGVILQLVKALSVAPDELLGLDPLKKSPPLPTGRRLLKRLVHFDALPQRKQEVLLHALDGLLRGLGR